VMAIVGPRVVFVWYELEGRIQLSSETPWCGRSKAIWKLSCFGEGRNGGGV